MPLRVSSLASLSWSLALLTLTAPAFADDPPRVFSQKPEVAPSRVRGEKGGVLQGGAGMASLAKGPAPTWIWGANDSKNYTFVAEFDLEGAVKSARIKATGDNSVTVFLNGKNVGSSEEWQEPFEADVLSSLKAGDRKSVV